MLDEPSLMELGWNSFFKGQLESAAVTGSQVPGRVVENQRTHLTVMYESGITEIPITGRWYKDATPNPPVVGDWVLLDIQKNTLISIFDRQNMVQRTLSQNEQIQVIAANVETLFLVTSCNSEFSLSRLTRYLILALESGAKPVVVITKRDLSDDPRRFVRQAENLNADVAVRLVNALDIESLSSLSAWLVPGKTIGLLGSSGVGKSTLVNTLVGQRSQQTGEVRHKDDKGRHTTTHRSLHLIPDGGLIIDSPGMRELGISHVEHGLATMFSDIVDISTRCQFSDCCHRTEPNCAVIKAVLDGRLDQTRLDLYRTFKG